MPDLKWENRFLKQGHSLVAGIDEAGRGAWAGPVVAAAVILPPARRGLRARLAGVDDSKQLTPLQRARLLEAIGAAALAVGVGGAGPEEIDRDGIVAATRAAMQRAVAMLRPAPQALLLDALELPALKDLPQRAILHGDSISLSVAAASIVAKVSRDWIMRAFEARYPGYGFARHKGYGTAAHQAALQAQGSCPAHRLSFAPVGRLQHAARPGA